MVADKPELQLIDLKQVEHYALVVRDLDCFQSPWSLTAVPLVPAGHFPLARINST